MNDVSDLNLFMVCEYLNPKALQPIPSGFSIRKCRRDELDQWMSFPFDQPEEANKNRQAMKDYFERVYAKCEEVFFQRCLFLCDDHNQPVATCFLWKAYGKFNTIHWLKTIKGYEGLGLGRALLSEVLSDVKQEDFPIYLHTQPTSYRAIKLYSDFGFELLIDPWIGCRENHYEEGLLYLKKKMPAEYYSCLKIRSAPIEFIDIMSKEFTNEF